MTPDNDNDTGVPPLVEERSARPPLDIAAKPPDDDTLIRDVEGAGTILKSIVSLLELVDWQHLVRGLEAAHTLGPIMDPTAYRDALHSGVLDTNGQILRAARDFHAVIAKLRERALADAIMNGLVR